MLGFIKRPLYALSNRMRRRPLPIELMKERWVANFSKPERSCFDIKPEIFRNAKLEKGSLFMGLEKSNCMAWLETADRVYTDQVIEARFRLDGMGGYCAAGIMFRVMEKGTYYLALVSNKGYFRLDAVNDNVPRTLVGWTEVTEADGEDLERATLRIVARGDHLIFTLDDRWIAEASDGSIPGGHLGFSLASYDPPGTEPPVAGGHVCEARLDHLSVDSGPEAVGRAYDRWSDGVEIGAESRLRLADTFAALDLYEAAHDQVLKAWRQREDAARSVTATYTDMRNGWELLFAARMASLMGRYETAERYVNACLSAERADEVDRAEVLAERAKVLSALGGSDPGKFRELVAFLPGYIADLEAAPDGPPIPPLYALLGHAWWNLGNRRAAADAWGRAFDLNGDNGLYAENAADARGALGEREESLRYLLAAGNRYLRQPDLERLGALVPRLLEAGAGNREAHRLVGEWAKATGDRDRAEAEFALANQAGEAPGREEAGKTEAVSDEAATGDNQGDTAREAEPATGKKPRARTKRARETTDGETEPATGKKPGNGTKATGPAGKGKSRAAERPDGKAAPKTKPPKAKRDTKPAAKKD